MCVCVHVLVIARSSTHQPLLPSPTQDSRTPDQPESARVLVDKPLLPLRQKRHSGAVEACARLPQPLVECRVLHTAHPRQGKRQGRARESEEGTGRAQGQRVRRSLCIPNTDTHRHTQTQTHRNTKAVRTCCAALRVRERSDDRSGPRRYRDDDEDADDDEDDTLVAATVTGSSASCSSAGLQCKHTNTRTPTR